VHATRLRCFFLLYDIAGVSFARDYNSPPTCVNSFLLARREKGKRKPGDDLLSRTVASTVPLALQGLTTLFGMGRGVAPAVMTPGILKEGFWDSRIQESSDFTRHWALASGNPSQRNGRP
jgi:hypothetical protein